MAISRMQQPRQMYNQGGLGALDAPRQNYGFGSFVKKAIRGVKKIAKSPLGKAVLIGGGMYGLNKFFSWDTNAYIDIEQTHQSHHGHDLYYVSIKIDNF